MLIWHLFNKCGWFCILSYMIAISSYMIAILAYWKRDELRSMNCALMCELFRSVQSWLHAFISVCCVCYEKFAKVTQLAEFPFKSFSNAPIRRSSARARSSAEDTQPASHLDVFNFASSIKYRYRTEIMLLVLHSLGIFKIFDSFNCQVHNPSYALNGHNLYFTHREKIKTCTVTIWTTCLQF